MGKVKAEKRGQYEGKLPMATISLKRCLSVSHSLCQSQTQLVTMALVDRPPTGLEKT